MAGSRQFQVIVANLSNDNKGIDNIVNYLKSIWKEWFDLLYNATNDPGKWFEDEYGDENYDWVGTIHLMKLKNMIFIIGVLLVILDLLKLNYVVHHQLMKILNFQNIIYTRTKIKNNRNK